MVKVRQGDTTLVEKSSILENMEKVWGLEPGRENGTKMSRAWNVSNVGETVSKLGKIFSKGVRFSTQEGSTI